MHAANNNILRRTAMALNQVGVIPIFSSINFLSEAVRGVTNPPPLCALAEEDMLEALRGTTFARFYEFFPGFGVPGLHFRRQRILLYYITLCCHLTGFCLNWGLYDYCSSDVVR